MCSWSYPLYLQLFPGCGGSGADLQQSPCERDPLVKSPVHHRNRFVFYLFFVGMYRKTLFQTLKTATNKIQEHAVRKIADFTEDVVIIIVSILQLFLTFLPESRLQTELHNVNVCRTRASFLLHLFWPNLEWGLPFPPPVVLQMSCDAERLTGFLTGRSRKHTSSSDSHTPDAGHQ